MSHSFQTMPGEHVGFIKLTCFPNELFPILLRTSKNILISSTILCSTDGQRNVPFTTINTIGCERCLRNSLFLPNFYRKLLFRSRISRCSAISLSCVCREPVRFSRASFPMHVSSCGSFKTRLRLCGLYELLQSL